MWSLFKFVLCLQIVLCHCCALSLSMLLATQLIFCPIYKIAISFGNQCVNQASSETSVASSFEEIIVIIWFWVWEETTRENVSWIILTARQKPENFNYWWGLVQNLPTGVAYQAFLLDLGQASQDHGTKVDQEMFPKYWSNPWPRRKTWEMESVIAALQREPMSPEEGELDCSHFLWWTLRKLRIQEYGPQTDEVHTKEIIWISPDSCIFHTQKSAEFLNFRCCLLGLKFDISQSTGVKWTLFRKEPKEDKSWHLKHWHWRQTLPERSISQAEQSSPPFPTRLWDGHWQWGIVTGKG